MGERQEFETALSAVLARIAPGSIAGLARLSGGANMESWSIDWLGHDGETQGFILRRSPSPEWSAGRPFGLATEAALVQAARAGGVLAPEVVAVLAPGDGLGDGYVMRRIEAEVNPAAILANPAPTLIHDIGRELARIHALPLSALPADIPTLDTAGGLADLKQRFIDYGGDRPIIAAAIRWLETHIPAPAPPVLVHGDFRMGNLMAGPDGLAGVLDWELAHVGDAHEDLAYGCMTVWRFAGHDRPAFGLSDLETLFAAYAEAGGVNVEPARFRFWLIYRTLWWALGCLQMGAIWRSGVDASLERAVIARRTAEQELDLLLLLEEEVPADIRHAGVASLQEEAPSVATGETSAAELVGAVADWIAAEVKPGAQGRAKFMAAVAINALGMVRRELEAPVAHTDKALADDLLSGVVTPATPGLLARLRALALAKLANDVPKYPALGVARQKWMKRP
jgi:aminoglycoside phosphotransferase (APT) family kinase protein